MSNIRKSIILELKQKNPNWSLRQIAYEVGVSRQYVFKIIGKQGKNLNSTPVKNCIYCGDEFKSYNSFYCSRNCQINSKQVIMTCCICGKVFSELKSQAVARLKRSKSKKIYCSKKCFGKFIGKTYGFKHKE